MSLTLVRPWFAHNIGPRPDRWKRKEFQWNSRSPFLPFTVEDIPPEVLPAIFSRGYPPSPTWRLPREYLLTKHEPFIYSRGYSLGLTCRLQSRIFPLAQPGVYLENTHSLRPSLPFTVEDIPPSPTWRLPREYSLAKAEPAVYSRGYSS